MFKAMRTKSSRMRRQGKSVCSTWGIKPVFFFLRKFWRADTPDGPNGRPGERWDGWEGGGVGGKCYE